MCLHHPSLFISISISLSFSISLSLSIYLSIYLCTLIMKYILRCLVNDEKLSVSSHSNTDNHSCCQSNSSCLQGNLSHLQGNSPAAVLKDYLQSLFHIKCLNGLDVVLLVSYSSSDPSSPQHSFAPPALPLFSIFHPSIFIVFPPSHVACVLFAITASLL